MAVAARRAMPVLTDAKNLIFWRTVADAHAVDKKAGPAFADPAGEELVCQALEAEAQAHAKDERIKINFHALCPKIGRAQPRRGININIFDVKVQEHVGCQINVDTRLCCPAKAVFQMHIGAACGCFKTSRCLV